MRSITTTIIFTALAAIVVAGCGGSSSPAKERNVVKPVTIAEGSGGTNNTNSVTASGDVPANAGPVVLHIKSKPYAGQYILVYWQVDRSVESSQPNRDEFNFKVKTNADIVILENQTDAARVSVQTQAIDAPTTLKVSLTTTKGSTATPSECAMGTEGATCPG